MPRTRSSWQSAATTQKTSTRPTEESSDGAEEHARAQRSSRTSSASIKCDEERSANAELSEFLEAIGIGDKSSVDGLGAKLLHLQEMVDEKQKEKHLVEENQKLDLELKQLEDDNSDVAIDQLSSEVELIAALKTVRSLQIDGLKSADWFESISFIAAKPAPFNLLFCKDYYEPSEQTGTKKRNRICPMLDEALQQVVISHDSSSEILSRSDHNGTQALFRSGFFAFLIAHERFPPGVIAWMAQEALFSSDRRTREAALSILKSRHADALLPISLLEKLLRSLEYRHVFPLFEVLLNQASNFLDSTEDQASSSSSPPVSSSSATLDIGSAAVADDDDADDEETTEWIEFVLGQCVVPAFFDRQLYSLWPLLQDILRALIDNVSEGQWNPDRFQAYLLASLGRLPADEWVAGRMLHLIRHLPTSSIRAQRLQYSLASTQMHRLFDQTLPTTPIGLGELHGLVDSVYACHIRSVERQNRLDWRRFFAFIALLDVCLTHTQLHHSTNDNTRLQGVLERMKKAIRENPARTMAPTQCNDVLTVMINRMRLFGNQQPSYALPLPPSLPPPPRSATAEELQSLTRPHTQSTLDNFFQTTK